MSIQTLLQLANASQSLVPALRHISPYDAAKLEACTGSIPTHGLSFHCRSPLCVSCSYARAERESHRLAHRLHAAESADPRRTLLYTTVTQPAVETGAIGAAVQRLTHGWNNLLRDDATRHVVGGHRVIEIKTDEYEPYRENVHLHGTLALAPAYRSGRYRRSKADWRELWAQCVGSDHYRSSETDPVEDIGRTAGYISQIDKFLNDAAVAESDPFRYIARADQMYRRRRYQSSGVLYTGPGSEWIN